MLSSVQVPRTAYARQGCKVCWYFTLNSLSSLFPIFVRGLLAGHLRSIEASASGSFRLLVSNVRQYHVFLVVYAVSHAGRIHTSLQAVTKAVYNLADLMALCHHAQFLGSPPSKFTIRSMHLERNTWKLVLGGAATNFSSGSTRALMINRTCASISKKQRTGLLIRHSQKARPHGFNSTRRLPLVAS